MMKNSTLKELNSTITLTNNKDTYEMRSLINFHLHTCTSSLKRAVPIFFVFFRVIFVSMGSKVWVPSKPT